MMTPFTHITMTRSILFCAVAAGLFWLQLNDSLHQMTAASCAAGAARACEVAR